MNQDEFREETPVLNIIEYFIISTEAFTSLAIALHLQKPSVPGFFLEAGTSLPLPVIFQLYHSGGKGAVPQSEIFKTARAGMCAPKKGTLLSLSQLVSVTCSNNCSSVTVSGNSTRLRHRSTVSCFKPRSSPMLSGRDHRSHILFRWMEVSDVREPRSCSDISPTSSKASCCRPRSWHKDGGITMVLRKCLK